MPRWPARPSRRSFRAGGPSGDRRDPRTAPRPTGRDRDRHRRRPEEVEDLISQDARRRPSSAGSRSARISSSTRSGRGAEVFAVPMDERGRRAFVERLQRLFPGLLEEGPSSPELVTQLSEVGQGGPLPGRRGGPARRTADPDPFVRRESRAGAARAHLGARPGSARPVPIGDPAPLSLVDSTAGGRRPSEGPEGVPNFVGPPDLDGLDGPRPGEPVTLLVWVTRPPRR